MSRGEVEDHVGDPATAGPVRGHHHAGDIHGLVGVFTPDGAYSAFGDTYRLDEVPEQSRRRPRACSREAGRILSAGGSARRPVEL
ncbi:hypothetical protein [Actinomadura sp. KC345]|uniref:hypothetical protein n=1 Tax=Actinomadura sp. KC345 TaxID=2530371 RepID=UPI001404D484|nr:hypothetical protein [Actinomadura sp. KC345]